MVKEITDTQRKIIFVGGIHGTGKTTLCNSICSQFNLEHISSGKLIADIKQINFSSNKFTTDINNNQDILIEAINKYLDYEKTYIMDGHFCLSVY